MDEKKTRKEIKMKELAFVESLLWFLFRLSACASLLGFLVIVFPLFSFKIKLFILFGICGAYLIIGAIYLFQRITIFFGLEPDPKPG